MCAFVAVCRHPGGAEEGTDVTRAAEGTDRAQGADQGRRRHRRLRAKCLIRRDSISTRRRTSRCTRRRTRGRAGWRSIRSGTSPSRHRRAPARRASSSIVTCACSKPASRRATSWRSRSRARPRRKCASASCRRCASVTAKGVSTRRGGARSAMRSTTSASARSTPSASRCCMNSRSRPASIPASIWPTKPKHRALSNRRSTARSPSAGPSRSTIPTWRCSSPSSASRACARR